MTHGEFSCLPRRFDFHNAKRPAFGFVLRLKLVPPTDSQAFGRLEFQNLTNIGYLSVGKDELPEPTDFPIGFHVSA